MYLSLLLSIFSDNLLSLWQFLVLAQTKSEWLPFEKEERKKHKARENALGAHYSTRVFKKMTEDPTVLLYTRRFKRGLVMLRNTG